METRANFFLLGASTIIGVVLILVFSAWLVGSDWRSGYEVYDVVFQGPIRGLTNGGEVRFNGIKVGEVKKLRVDELDAERVVARIQISSTTPLRTDSAAQLEDVGLTGVTLVQLSAGTPRAPRLRPRLGSPPPRIQARPGIVESLLTTDNAQRLTEVLINLRSVSRSLAQNDSVVGESAITARDLAAAARAVRDLSLDMRAQWPGLARDAHGALTHVGDAAAQADAAFARLNAAADVATNDTLPRLGRAADSIARTSSDMDHTLTTFERSPAGYLTGQSLPVVPVEP